MPSDVPTRKILVVDEDEVVAFIASHILSRHDFDVQTASSAGAVVPHADGFDAVIVSASIAAQLRGRLDPARTVLIGDPVEGLKPYARLRKPVELDQLLAVVAACAKRR